MTSEPRTPRQNEIIRYVMEGREPGGHISMIVFGQKLDTVLAEAAAPLRDLDEERLGWALMMQRGTPVERGVLEDIARYYRMASDQEQAAAAYNRLAGRSESDEGEHREAY